MVLETFAYSYLAAALLLGAFVLPALRMDVNFADEGYLWYGCLRVLEGDIPIRDFRGYDPGRYYLLAVWMRVFGSNLLSLRAGLLFVLSLGFACWLYTAHLATGNWAWTLLAGFALLPWIQQRFKWIENAFSMFALFFAALLLQVPGPSTYLAAGVFLGLSGLMGLNLAVYHGFGLCAAMLVSGLTTQAGIDNGSGFDFALGALFGYSPMLLMFARYPGFLRCYWRRKVVEVVRRGSSNLPVRIPFLWRTAPEHMLGMSPARRGFYAVWYSAMPLILGAAVIWLFLVDAGTIVPHAPLLAGIFVGVGYMHYAYSRADPPHLARAMPPMLLVCTAMLAPLGFVGLTLMLVIFLSSCWAVLPNFSPLYKFAREHHHYTLYAAPGGTLRIHNTWAKWLGRIRELVERYSRTDTDTLFLPTKAILYPLMNKRVPVYDVFCVYPATEAEQETMLREIRHNEIRFALIDNIDLDGREDRRFARTHPLVWRFLRENFTEVEQTDLPPHWKVFVRC